MTSDNSKAPDSNAEGHGLSPEVADFFGETMPEPEKTDDNTDEKKDKNVNSEEETEETQDDENASETEENKTTEDEDEDEEGEDESEDEEDDEEDDSEDEDEDDANASKTYKIGGQEFKSVDKVVERAKSIYGDNSRMAGEIKDLNAEIEELSKKTGDVEALKEAIKKKDEIISKWNQFMEGEIDERPKEEEVDVETKVKQELEKKEEEKRNKERDTRYQTELDELKALPDFQQIVPEMIKVSKRFFKTDVKVISPKELYNLTKALSKADGYNDSVIDAVKETNKKNGLKSKAKKRVGGSNRKASTKPKGKLSPEIADYLNNNT